MLILEVLIKMCRPNYYENSHSNQNSNYLYAFKNKSLRIRDIFFKDHIHIVIANRYVDRYVLMRLLDHLFSKYSSIKKNFKISLSKDARFLRILLCE